MALIRRDDVQEIGLGQVSRRDIARVAAAAPDQVRRTHHHLDAMGVAGARGLDRGRELGEMRAVEGGPGDMGGLGVVMAGQHRAIAAGGGHGGGFMDGTVAGGKRLLVAT